MKEPRTRGWQLALDRPVTVLMLLCSILVIGVIAKLGVPLILFPPGIVAGSISVSVPVPESTPQEVMEQVAVPAEELFRTIPGTTKISSFSGASFCQIRVQYSGGADGDAIYADIRDRMERLLPSFPEGADRYRIFRFNLDTDVQVMSCAATYSDEVHSPETLLENVIRPRLEATEGVARADVRGLVGRQVSIELIPERVTAHSVDVRALVAKLRGENLLVPGGPVDDGGRRWLVRVSQRFQDLDEIRSLRIDDALTLGDIADVRIRRGVDRFLVRVDGELCQVVEVFKESEANAVDVCKRLRHVYEEELTKDPRLSGFTFHIFFDQGETITQQIGNLQSTCLWGGLLAVVVLFLFIRRLRPTLLIAAAIPLSLLIAVVSLFFRGGTFNFLSLTGLTLAIGMLIDNAIVVSENILHYRERGLDPREAAGRGVSEVALAVTLATLTTVAVFVPLIFLGEDSNTRVIMRELGLPVCESLLASLFVALVFIPTGAAKLLPLGSVASRAVGADPRGGRMMRLYRRSIVYGLRHRLPLLVLLAVALGSQAIPLGQLQKEGKGGRPSNDHYVNVDFPVHSTLIEADEIMEKIRESLESLREKVSIETIVSFFDTDDGTTMLILEPGQLESQEVMQSLLKERLPDIPGIEYRFPGAEEEREGRRIDISATGRDPSMLAVILADLAERLRGIPGILAVSTPTDDTNEEISVVVERERAQRFDVNPTQVSGIIGWMLRGAPLPDFEVDGEELPMWIRFQEQELDGFGDLYQVQVFNQQGQSLPLATLARFEVGKSLPSIRRVDRRVTSRLGVTLEPGAKFENVGPAVLQQVRETELPTGYHLLSQDGSREFEESLKDVKVAGILGLVLIFGLMGVLFESVLLPLSVICSIPFLFVGAFWSCYLFGETLTPEALVGFVILIGIVVNNAIVLVDCINRFRAQGMSRSKAIIEGSRARFRPIWMTSLTTICGLLPLILIPDRGEGMSFRPIGVVVLGGLASATIFTTIGVPIFYSIFDDLGRWFLGDRGTSTDPEPALDERS